MRRREFIEGSAATLAGAALAWGQQAGDRPPRAEGVTVLNPRGRIPVSFIIDDSTCLVNLAHFCIPQFGEVFPDKYKQDWRKLPREIPDAFVAKFGEWCHHHGVKGKYSVVPYPACVGWIDREMPGWTRKELEASLDLLRGTLARDWDFHPEMVTHTWAIDTKTGRPHPERTEKFMENWGFSAGKSVDELTDYLSYALRPLKNAGLPCEGITTPGGFGGRVKPELAQAALLAVREVFKAEIPHYFKYLVSEGKGSVAPRVEYASGLDGPDPKCVVNIIGCTGDWTGGWDGVSPVEADKFITEDLKGGRLPEVIARGEPALLFAHWAGIYFNGEELGFKAFQTVVRRLHAAYDNLAWMKLTEISRYWAAKELTRIDKEAAKVTFRAPFASPDFTVRIAGRGVPKFAGRELRLVNDPLDLDSGAWTRAEDSITACFDLPKGASELTI